MPQQDSFSVVDYAVSGESFKLKKHPELDIWVTDPVPGELDKYYNSEAYISHTDASKSLFEKLYQGIKDYSLNNKLRLLKKHIGEVGTLLDYGAGTGAFVQRAKARGWQAEGVEPNSAARARAKEKGVLLKPDWEGCEDGTYDAISLWHVLEHLPDLHSSISRFNGLLKPKGVLVLALPNYLSWDATHYGSYWAGYDVPRHLWHFSKPGISSLMSAHNLELVATKPLYFDAFYVALLSEKYRTGKMRWLHAIINGLRSNTKALVTGEYSSLIYVFKKTENAF